MPIQWPDRWQPEACEALLPYFGSDSRVEIVVDPPTSIDGTSLAGFVYLDDDVPMIIHDRSGKPGVYPWKLFLGPVLRIYLKQPRHRPTVLFAHPDWAPRHSE